MRPAWVSNNDGLIDRKVKKNDVLSVVLCCCMVVAVDGDLVQENGLSSQQVSNPKKETVSFKTLAIKKVSMRVCESF